MSNLAWFDIYQHRYEWAKLAHSKFMSHFDNQLYSSSEIKDQVYVSVYGPSQVGKTSLILELISVSPQSYNHVENILRGDRGYGRSSTSTIVRYRASENDSWFITKDDEHTNELLQLNDEQAKKHLSSLRYKMERYGKNFNIESIDILIPKKHLKPNSRNHKDIIIRDLPGVNAENEQEREFVLKVIKKSIETSDLVLMVTTIDNLGLIVQPENLELDELQNWMVRPHRFKIVLTRFFSDASSLNFCTSIINKNESISTSVIRQYINKQINTHDNEWDISEQLYALELGQSWLNYLDSDSAKQDSLVKHIKLIRESFFEELKDVIYSSNNPISRLAYGYQIGKVAEKIKSIENQKAKKEIQSITNEIKKIQRKIKKDSEYIKKSYEEIEIIRKNYQEAFNEQNSSSLKTVSMPENIKQRQTETTVTELQKMLTYSIIELNKQWSTLINCYSNFFKLSEFKIVDEIVNIQTKLAGYKLSSYWMKKNYEEDLNQVMYSIKRQIDELNQIIYQSYNKYQYEIFQQNVEEIKLLEIRKHQVAQRREKLKGKLKTLESDLEDCKLSLKRFNAERDQEIEHSKNFTKHIEPEFQNALQFFSKKAKLESDKKNKIYWILLVRLIKIDFEIVKGRS